MAAISWTGAAGDGNYNNAANWSPMQVPGATDTVTIAPSAAVTIGVNQSDAAKSLTTAKVITLAVGNGDTLTVGNAATASTTLSNAGTIELNGYNAGTTLLIGSPRVTVSGGGTILLNNNGNSVVTGAAAKDVLSVTSGTIAGGGQLGAGALTLSLGSGGVIDANDGTQLVFNTGTIGATSAGLFEATGGSAGLIIASSISQGTAGRIVAAGAAVTLQSGAVIAGGTVSSTGTADILIGNTATLDGRTNAVTNAGTIAVQNGTTLTLLGTITNTGTIAYQSYNAATGLLIGPVSGAAGTVTLGGAGVVAMTDSGASFIYGNAAGDTLVNATDTITGAGTIGGASLTLINDAVIDATGGNALVLTSAGTLTNNALLESNGTGGLTIATIVQQAGGGTIDAAAGSVTLAGGTVAGGLLESGAGEAVTVLGGNTGTLDGSKQTVANAGLVSLANGGTLDLLGTIANQGTVTLNGYNANTDLIAASATLTLTGGGVIALNDNGGNRIYGAVAADVLDNVNNTIVGAGQIGAAQLTLINAAAGTIDAVGTNQLILNTGTIAITNAGLIEATGGGSGLAIDSRILNSGTIAAVSAVIDLNNGASIAGGVLQSGTGEAITVLGGNTAALDGSTSAVTSTGVVSLSNGSTLDLLGTISNQGTITLSGYNANTDLVAASATVTLTGGGTVALNDNGGNRIYGAVAADVLDNINDTIVGAGQIGAAQLTLINAAAGTIDAVGSNQLILNTGTIAITNAGLIEATTGGGGLVIQSRIGNSGQIAATGDDVFLDNGASIAGGTISSSGGGAFMLLGGNTGTLDASGGKLTSTGLVSLANGSTLDLLGTITNQGTITLGGYNADTDLVAASATVTLTGGGTVALNDNTNNRIYGATVADTLIDTNNVISGSGQILQLAAFVNQSTIDSSGSNGIVVSGLTQGVLNSGLLEATGSGGLSLDGIVVHNATTGSTAGVVLAASGNVYLNGASVAGGTIGGSGGGAITVNGGQTGTLDGSAGALTNTGPVAINNGATLALLGTITNQGTIALAGYNADTDLIAASSTVTLGGGGTVALDDNGNNRIYGVSGADTLDNVNDTIAGAGQFGVGQLHLVNAGTIDASGSNALLLNLLGTTTSSGLLEATGSGGLVIQAGTYTNTGTIEAASGSSVTFDSGTVLTNQSGGTLTGGAYLAIGGAIALTGPAITTDAATIVLSGTASAVSAGGTALASSLTTIAAHSQLQLLAGAAYTTAQMLTNYGTLVLGGGTLTAAALTDRVSGTLTGFGTVTANLTSLGTLVATGGTLDLKGNDNVYGAVSGTGTLVLDHGRDGFATTNVTVSTIDLINGASLNLAKSLSFAGTFDIVGQAIVSGVGTFTNTGTFEQTGTASATVSAPFVNDGTVAVAAGGALLFSGGFTNAGTIVDNGGFTDNAALNGGTLVVGAGAAATVSAASGAGNGTVANLALAGRLNTNGTTLTVTGDYTNTNAGTGNKYNPFAFVTGTIDGQGTQLSVVGVNGTTIMDVNGQMTIEIAPHGTASFVIENTGASGSAALRGALQTTVNGGSINGNQLTGSGVTAGNYGPIAAGGQSGVYTITDRGGPIANEAIHIASDFANVAGVTIAIVQQPQAAAAMGAMASQPVRPDLLAVSQHG